MLNLWIVLRANILLVFSQFKSWAKAISRDLMLKSCIITKKIRMQLLSICFLLVFIAAPSAHAVLLNDWIFNIDGTISENFMGDTIPTTGTLGDGLGTLSLEITGAGAHNVIGFFDFELDQNSNTYYNEFADVTGTPGIGQSWEIDEPGWIFGDIVDNVFSGTLDNTNAVPMGSEDDVAFAMGWDFSLLDGDVAVIEYVFTEELPMSDFFLTHSDPYSAYSFYLYSTLTIETSGGPIGPKPPTPTTPVPEPGTALLMLSGLLILSKTKKRHISSCAKRSVS